MTRRSFVPLGLVAGLIVLVADQASKWWVLNVLDLEQLRQVVLLAAISLAVVGALGLWLRRAETAAVGIAIGAIAGGAIGNVIDRLRFGAVVDFIHAHVDTPWGDLSWYVFNVADAAIVCGVAALIIDSQFSRRRQEKSA
jgi:signal peptidase II